MLGRREWLGLLAAPAPFAWPLPLLGLPELVRGDVGLVTYLLLSTNMLLFPYFSVIVLGLPFHLILRSRGRRDLLSYLATAVAVGSVLALIAMAATNNWIFPPDPTNPLRVHIPPWAIAIAALLSLIPAFLFWVVAVRKPELGLARQLLPERRRR